LTFNKKYDLIMLVFKREKMRININKQDYTKFSENTLLGSTLPERYAARQYLNAFTFSVVKYENEWLFKLSVKRQYMGANTEKKVLEAAMQQLNFFFSHNGAQYTLSLHKNAPEEIPLFKHDLCDYQTLKSQRQILFTASAFNVLASMLSDVPNYYGHRSFFSDKESDTIVLGQPLTPRQVMQFKSFEDAEFVITGENEKTAEVAQEQTASK